MIKTGNVRATVCVAVLTGMAALVLAAPSFACIPHNFISASPSSGAAGTVVNIHGHTFDAAAGVVEIRWGGVAGQVVATAKVDAAGAIASQFVLPATVNQSGHYLIKAVQVRADGAPMPAQPTGGLFAFEVVAPAPIPVEEPAVAAPSEAKQQVEAVTLQPSPAPLAAQESPVPAEIRQPRAAPSTQTDRVPVAVQADVPVSPPVIAPKMASPPTTPSPAPIPTPSVGQAPVTAANPARPIKSESAMPVVYFMFGAVGAVMVGVAIIVGRQVDRRRPPRPALSATSLKK